MTGDLFKQFEELLVPLAENVRLLDLELQKDYQSASNLREILRRIKQATSNIDVLIATVGIKENKK